MLYVEINPDSEARHLQYAPCLDFRTLADGERDAAAIRGRPECTWISRDFASRRIANTARRVAQQNRDAVKDRLTKSAIGTAFAAAPVRPCTRSDPQAGHRGAGGAGSRNKGADRSESPERYDASGSWARLEAVDSAGLVRLFRGAMVAGSATARRHTRSDYLTGYGGQQGGISATISPAFFEPSLPKDFGVLRAAQGYCAVTRNSLLFGGVNPVTTIKWIGGHRSLMAAASRRLSIERGIVPGSVFSGPIALRLAMKGPAFIRRG
jgi:hypothetical protein